MVFSDYIYYLCSLKTPVTAEIRLIFIKSSLKLRGFFEEIKYVLILKKKKFALF